MFSRHFRSLLMVLIALIGVGWTGSAPARDGEVVAPTIRADAAGPNRIKPDGWRAFEQGFERDGTNFVCDNGADTKASRGAAQTVILNQKRPEPIVATVESRAEGVTGGANADYSLYLDLVYEDGSPLWGQVASFKTGTHDWQRGQVLIMPEKPVKSVTMNLLLRGHGGKAWFRAPELRAISTGQGGTVFDGVPVARKGPISEGFLVRDAATKGNFVRIERKALGLELEAKPTKNGSDSCFFDVTLSDPSGADRAITLIYVVPIAPEGLTWFDGPRQAHKIETSREYVHATQFPCGGSGRLSLYPLGAVTNANGGTALGIDIARPAFFHVGYNAGLGVLFLAYDVALTREHPSASVRFVKFAVVPRDGFRGALAKYYDLFPEAFRVRVSKQGLWMPFAKISAVPGWEDFGFAFKEGNDETAWDDQHDIITFRYTEPMTWWMGMPKSMPRTIEAALKEVHRLADQGRKEAQALLTSGHHDPDGQFVAQFLDTPWTNGAVWSMNSMPGIKGDVTDFKNKWNDRVREQLYGPHRKGDLDGEYVDSSEGYVTAILDYRRDHLGAAETPLVFDSTTCQPAIFRGLIAFEYVRGIERDIHGMGKLMMANGAPDRLCWLVPLLDVTGTETDWNHQGHWRPMSDADLLYRRALTRGKPYCFLMNTQFDKFSYEHVEKYMKRSLAYGMFPGFFSADASTGHYFTRKDLYDRDRPLFKKYVPLSELVAEAGWQPITGAQSNDEHVYVERFGAGSKYYLTVFNDSTEKRTATITLEGKSPASSRELVSGRTIEWAGGKATLELGPEDVAVLEVK